MWGQLLAAIREPGSVSVVSTVREIEAAIDRLPAAERDTFEGRLIARRCGIDALDSDEHRDLLASLDEAEREIDSGHGVTADDLRQRLAGWAGK
jgi:hypothetical protein